MLAVRGSRVAKKDKDIIREFCGNCYYWLVSASSMRGRCRFNPPTFNPITSPVAVDNDEPYWPRTLPEDWCGKFKSTPENKSKEVKNG